MNQNEQKDQVNPLLIRFTKYKLMRIRMEQFQDAGAKKLIFKIHLDNLSNPRTMKLWVYPAKNHRHYAEGETGDLVPAVGTSTFNDTNDIIIGNTEVALKYFHEGNDLENDWRDFVFITLDPKKNGNNLVFRIGYDEAGGLLPGDETNPCPPARPEEQ